MEPLANLWTFLVRQKSKVFKGLAGEFRRFSDGVITLAGEFTGLASDFSVGELGGAVCGEPMQIRGSMAPGP